MIYRQFGKTGKKVSRLGFGVMRLPTKKINDKDIVDMDLSTPLLQKAYELGVNYFDTAPYYVDSQSEGALGEALHHVRDKILISTKLPLGEGCEDKFFERLETSLKKLNTDYIDFYHFWGINLDTYNNFIKDKLIKDAISAKEQGLIRHISFSFHGPKEQLQELVQVPELESVLCQYNLVDQVNDEAINLAHQNEKGVVVMGPVAGGMLSNPANHPHVISPEAKSGANLALRFVMSNPGVDIILSGMSTMEMLLENVETINCDQPLIPEQLNEAIEEKRKLLDLYCTGCNYCMPCPAGVEIPSVFRAMNLYKVYNLEQSARDMFEKLKSNCVECGACLSKCPQKLPIIQRLQECREALS